jgi:hypothetical protein
VSEVAMQQARAIYELTSPNGSLISCGR